MPSKDELLKKAQDKTAKAVPSPGRNLDALKNSLKRVAPKPPKIEPEDLYQHKSTATSTGHGAPLSTADVPVAEGAANQGPKEPFNPQTQASVDGILTFEDLKAKKFNKNTQYLVPFEWIDFEDSEKLISDRETYNRERYEVLREKEAFKRLVADIKEFGQQYAGRVRVNEFGLLKITDGWRRALASRDAGREGYLCTITEESDQEAAINALRLNLMREDLPEYNKLFEIKKLNEKFNLTYEAIAERTGFGDKVYISNCLVIFKVPAVEEALKANRITISTGRHLARHILNNKLPDGKARQIVELVVKKEIQVKDLKFLDHKAKDVKPKAATAPRFEVKDDGSFSYPSIRFKPGSGTKRDLEKTIDNLEEILKVLKKELKDRAQ